MFQLVFWGAAAGFLSVALGAFGAHALKSRLDSEHLAIYHTAVQYQMMHAVGTVIAGVLVRMLPGAPWVMWAGWLFVLGIVLFSGSLYALSITRVKRLGAITPFGGLAFLAGWVVILAAAAR